jgi:hypothetical protein
MLATRMATVALFPLVLVGSAAASEEEFLTWSEVRITFPEREDTGKVVLSVKTNAGKYEEMKIEAFGKTFELGRAELNQLHDFPLNSLVTTHEAGYPKLGGHTIHFKLKRLQYNEQQQMMEHHVIVGISKGKGLAVTGPTIKPVENAP